MNWEDLLQAYDICKQSGTRFLVTFPLPFPDPPTRASLCLLNSSMENDSLVAVERYTLFRDLLF